MSFFTNPYYAHQQRRGQAQAQHHPFVGNPFATQSPYSLGINSNQYDSTTSIDDEERAAIAHLRSIQRRKEAERILREEAERERAIAELQVQREREAAIIARVQHEREIALARVKAEKEREYARYIAAIQAQAQAQAQQEERQRRVVEHQRRQQQRQYAIAQARQQELEDRRRQCARHCAAKRAIAAAAPPAENRSTSDTDLDLEGLNRFIGSLFGLQLEDKVQDNKSKSTPATETTPVSVEVGSKPTSVPAQPSEKPASATEQKKEFPEAINNLLANFLGVRVEPESKLGQAVSNKVPEGLNKVPEGLNELLGQFGLEFVPDAPKAESSTSTDQEIKKQETPVAPVTASAPTPSSVAEEKKQLPAASSGSTAAPAPQAVPRHPFDLSELLSGQAGQNALPPFVRDILGNVELALKNERDQEVKQDKKGKGVAEGEKEVKTTPKASTTAPAPTTSTPIPTPTPAQVPVPVQKQEEDSKKTSTESINKLESIESDIKLVRDSFTFPSDLSFSTQSTQDASPSLLFNKQNKPYHAQNNKLLQLLLQADGVASNGDKEVRRKRKQVVKLVEAELESLEKRRDEIWKIVKERREAGEESGHSSEDEGSSWTTGSTVDRDEPVHVEDVASTAPTTAVPTITEESTEVPQKAQTSTFAEAVKAGPESVTHKVEIGDATESTDNVTDPAADPSEPETNEKVGEKKDKEEGYELL